MKNRKTVFDRLEDGSLFKGFIIAWFVWALVCLAGMVAAVWVAAHFISKYW